MKKIIFISIVLLACKTITYAQSGIVKGIIKTSDGLPAEYVHIGLAGTAKGTSANAKGEFEIRNIVPGTYVLRTSFVGLESLEQTLEIRANETLQLPEIILKENAQVLNEVVIKSQAGESYLATDASEQLRLQSSLFDTPQSIIVVSEQVIKDQQAFNVNELARNVSGVNSVFSYTSLYADFSIRGGGQSTANNRLRNGIRPNGYAMMEDASNIERIEFVKGPSGFMMNYGDPGGLMNVVTKQPTYNKIRNVSLTTGSFGLYRTAVDFGGGLGSDTGKLSYRLSGAAHYGGQHQDYHTFTRYSVAPSVRYQMSQNTSVTFEYNLNYSKSRGADGTIPGAQGGNAFVLPQTFGIADPNLPGFVNYDNLGSVKLVHSINERWKFNGVASASNAQWLGYELNTRSVPDSAGMLPRRLVYTDYRGQNYISQFFVTGTETTGSITHKILAGVDMGVQQTQYPAYNRRTSDYFSIDVNNPSYGLHPDSLKAVSTEKSSDRDAQQWQSVYLQDHISFTDWLQLSLAGRYSYFTNYASWNIPEEQTQKFNVLTPRIGLTVKPLSNIAVYALYDQSFVPQSGRVYDGSALKPQIGDIKEIGIKTEWLNNKLMANVAFYDITRNNITNADAINIGYVIQTGQAKTTGLEVDVIGKLTDNISLIANYAYTDGRVTKDVDEAVVGVLPYGIVKHLANVWLKYQLNTTRFKGLGAAVGGTHDSGRGGGTFSSDGNYRKITPSFTKLDAALYYDRSKINFALNVDNLTNAEYMTGGYWDAAWFYKPGAPINFRTTVTVKL